MKRLSATASALKVGAGRWTSATILIWKLGERKTKEGRSGKKKKKLRDDFNLFGSKRVLCIYLLSVAADDAAALASSYWCVGTML